MRFPKATRLLVIGNGPQVLTAVAVARERSLSILVATSPRQAQGLVAFEGETKTLARHLQSRDVEMIEAASADDLLKRLDKPALAGTFIFSFGAPWIFKKPFLEAFGGRVLNFHGSRLPRDRGSAGWSWGIMDGLRLGYCAAHLVDEGIDTGPLVMLEEFAFSKGCRLPADFDAEAAQKRRPAMAGLLDRLIAGEELQVQGQPEHLSSYWPRLNTAVHGWIDWSWSPEEIERFACAFDDPYPGAQTLWDGETVHLKGVWAHHEDGAFHPFKAGIVYRKSADHVAVAARGGSLLIHSVLDREGKSVAERVRLGDRFHTPAATLDAARQERVQYKPDGTMVVVSKRPERSHVQ